ncbi:MAG TPA: hypothetical protein VEC99_00460, partial [Clostridia bacterium]|nr:hypothetical protein [Clostridia bacterium]
MDAAPAQSAPRHKLTPWRGFLSVFLAVFLVIFSGSAVVTYMLPETYQGVARVKVPDSEQGETFQSAATLSRVAEQLNLKQRWVQEYGEKEEPTKDQVVDKLRRTSEVRRLPDASLVEIRAFHNDPRQAADLANAIARIGASNIERASRQKVEVEVVDLATIAMKPVRPNKPLNLTLGALVGIFLGIMAGGVGARLAVGVDPQMRARSQNP